MVKLIQAHTVEHIGQIRELLQEYAASLDLDLCFQNFACELAGLPGHYALPEGRLLMAIDDTTVAGCVAMRKIDGETCEMKRLYVRREFRGKGIGRVLVKAILAEARAVGYERMRLDTLPQMKEAIALYQCFGFYPIPPYRHNPVSGALFFEMNLKN
jgi:GNAT superfamily N-acetyltransferase